MGTGNSTKLILVTVIANIASFGHSQSTTIFPAVITFGDSTVDVGNNNYIPKSLFKANYFPYGKDFIGHKPTGRFCNGKLPTDITAEIMGFKNYAPPYLSPEAKGKNLLLGANFASAGSGFEEKFALSCGAISLPKQLVNFRQYKTRLAKVAGPKTAASIINNALYILSAGSGDFVQNYYINSSLNKAVPLDRYNSHLIQSFSTFVKELYGLGARKLGVTSLPPFGCFPAAHTLLKFKDTGKNCVYKINNEAQQFNHRLNETSEVLQKQLKGLKIVVFDIFNPLSDMVKSPSKHGFVEARRPCCETQGRVGKISVLCNPKSAQTYCANATQYVFWDDVHPSEAANRILADTLVLQGIALV